MTFMDIMLHSVDAEATKHYRLKWVIFSFSLLFFKFGKCAIDISVNCFIEITGKIFTVFVCLHHGH